MQKIIWFGKSEKGDYRDRNEDYFRFYEIGDGHYFLAIADGMGGHSHGDLASKLAVDFCLEFYRKNYFKEEFETDVLLEKALFFAHNQIRNMTNNYKKDIIVGTTLSVIVFKDKTASLVHVGDTRIYLLREGKILQLTTDHSLVNTLKRLKLIDKKEAEVYPNKNVLTQSVGVRLNISPQRIKKIETRKDDIFLLTTDGLHAMFDNNEIVKVFKSYRLKDALKYLVNEALLRGSRDNVTGLAIKFNR